MYIECSEEDEDSDVAVGMLSAGCQNVGYRLGLRNVLSERRKRVADYSLACALFGLVVVVVETEMSLAQLYDKVRFYFQHFSHALRQKKNTLGHSQRRRRKWQVGV